MHIVHLTPYMGLGGTERCIINLISQGLDKGYQLSLISPPGPGLKRLSTQVRVHLIENWSASRPFRSIDCLKTILLKVAEQADLIQVHAAAEMAYLSKRFLPTKPLIFTCHGYDNFLRSRLNYWVASRFLGKVEQIIILNPQDESSFIKAGIEKEKLVIIPNGVEERFFTSIQSKRPSCRLVGLVGRLVKQKRPAWAIKAQAKYKFASRLLLIGEGPLRFNLERLVKELHLENEVEFLGYQEKPEEIYPSLSYLLLCSCNEAFPLVILESLAAGVPVLIPYWLTGLKKFWSSLPGIIIYRKAEEIKTRIEQSNFDPVKLQKFARSFLWENIFPRYQEVYNRLIT